MKILARHMVLANGTDAEEARSQVIRFFESTPLVRYDKISFQDERTRCGSEDGFSAALADSVAQNKRILAGFIEELGDTGYHSCIELSRIDQGYPSKVLHIIAHFLDGFIGIDSAFYNLVDDSHWLSDDTAGYITENPGHYWLFSLECFALSPEEASILRM